MIGYTVYILCGFVASAQCIPELKLLHVVFAHKTYAPISSIIHNNETNFPSNLTYEYFDSAATDIPKAGKLNMFNLGVYLRDTYGEFLGDIYTNDIMKMRTTEHALSMMAGQIVNAALWPPSVEQKWSEDIEWQPIPMDYVQIKKDTLLLGTYCPSFISEMETVLNTKEVQETMMHHLPLFDYVSHYTGMEIQRPSDIALLYSSLETKADLNESLPYWANEIFPHGEMYNVSLLEYDLLSQTTLQKQLNGGTIIKEVIANSLKYTQGLMSNKRKIMLYSGNERNLVGILKSLDLWSPHIPNEGASVIFEMYFDNETETYGTKINYYTGFEGDIIPLTVPHCTQFCPLKSFVSTFFHVIPQNEGLLCNERFSSSPKEEIAFNSTVKSRSSSYKARNIIMFFLLAVVLNKYISRLF